MPESPSIWIAPSSARPTLQAHGRILRLQPKMVATNTGSFDPNYVCGEHAVDCPSIVGSVRLRRSKFSIRDDHAMFHVEQWVAPSEVRNVEDEVSPGSRSQQ